MQIYESQGWTRREAVRSILENNLYALDIDERAAQLAYFAVMMKARSYDRRFLSRRSEDETPDIPQPHVRAIRESGRQAKNAHTKSRRAKELIARLLMDFADAKPLGSIIRPSLTLAELATIREELSKGDLSDAALLAELTPLLEQAEMLVQKYDAVVTNPPYMGMRNMGSILSEFVKENYPDSKTDMSTVMMERTLDMAKQSGYMAMINIPVWMFLLSFEKLRDNILRKNTYINMVHPGRGIFGSDFGTTTFVIAKQHIPGYRGCYYRLFDVQGEVKGIEEREQTFLSGKGRYTANQDNFAKIPGAPVAYWVSEKFIECFNRGYRIDDVGDFTGSQNITADNDKYLRYHWEIIRDIARWKPYAKGGGFRKWYGNILHVVRWDDSAREFYKNNKTSNLLDDKYVDREGIAYTDISSQGTGFRYFSGGAFDKSGPVICISEKLYNVLAILNSCVMKYYLSIVNPTIHTQTKDVKQFPLIEADNSRFVELAKENVSISRADWDSFETSWDFARHPLVRGLDSVRAAFEDWQRECERRFAQLKANEEELNRIFIDIYGLQDELTPEVLERDVTVRRAELGRDIRSLLSYAVGCMFGRYSLDAPGLAYAGGAWDPGKYGAFPPDGDNCIPITDEAYFADDIVERFCEFLRVAFGANKLEENLDFIAAALGSRGATSREVIRNYFLNDFYADHVKLYQKRPIYWLFDSGKQNGFKALVYMHRWSADTAGNVRVEYLHRVQRVYEREIARMKDVAEGEANTREGNAARRRADKLIRQLRETREYDARLGHAANTRPTIDLDDGVKLNYEKVQRGPDGKSLNILAKI